MLKKVKIVIVGAGAAGIAAATRLLKKGVNDFIVLEALDRIGGRICTVDFGDNVVDLGAQWVHGESENVVFELAHEHELLDSFSDFFDVNKHEFVTINGEVIPKEESVKALTTYYDIMKDASEELSAEEGSLGDYFRRKYFHIISEERAFASHTRAKQFLSWMEKMANSIECSDTLDDVSAKRLTEYWECKGDSVLNWKDKGYKKLFDLLTQRATHTEDNSPVMKRVKFNKIVETIDYSSEENVLVTTKDGYRYFASHVIFTASLGVLKEKHSTMFVPRLPESKERAIKELYIGTANKVFMEFSCRWWPSDVVSIDIVCLEEDKKEFLQKHGESYKWLCDVFSFFIVSYQPHVLCAWIVGKNARYMETLSDLDVSHGLSLLLKETLGKRYYVVEPDRIVRSKWYTDEHFRGSYSFQSMDSERADVRPRDLAEPIIMGEHKPVILFAGEATHDHYYSTVHGAVETGFREADRLIDFDWRTRDCLDQLANFGRLLLVQTGLDGKIIDIEDTKENGISAKKIYVDSDDINSDSDNDDTNTKETIMDSDDSNIDSDDIDVGDIGLDDHYISLDDIDMSITAITSDTDKNSTNIRGTDINAKMIIEYRETVDVNTKKIEVYANKINVGETNSFGSKEKMKKIDRNTESIDPDAKYIKSSIKMDIKENSIVKAKKSTAVAEKIDLNSTKTKTDVEEKNDAVEEDINLDTEESDFEESNLEKSDLETENIHLEVDTDSNAKKNYAVIDRRKIEMCIEKKFDANYRTKERHKSSLKSGTNVYDKLQRKSIEQEGTCDLTTIIVEAKRIKLEVRKVRRHMRKLERKTKKIETSLKKKSLSPESITQVTKKIVEKSQIYKKGLEELSKRQKKFDDLLRQIKQDMERAVIQSQKSKIELEKFVIESKTCIGNGAEKIENSQKDTVKREEIEVDMKKIEENVQKTKARTQKVEIDTKKIEENLQKTKRDETKFETDSGKGKTGTQTTGEQVSKIDTNTGKNKEDPLKIKGRGEKVYLHMKEIKVDMRKKEEDQKKIETDANKSTMDTKKTKEDRRKVDIDTDMKSNKRGIQKIKVKANKMEVDARKIETDARKIEVEQKNIVVGANENKKAKGIGAGIKKNLRKAEMAGMESIEVIAKKNKIDTKKNAVGQIKRKLDVTVYTNTSKSKADTREVKIDGEQNNECTKLIEIDLRKIKSDCKDIEVNAKKTNVDSKGIIIRTKRDSKKIEVDRRKIKVISKKIKKRFLVKRHKAKPRETCKDSLKLRIVVKKNRRDQQRNKSKIESDMKKSKVFVQRVGTVVIEIEKDDTKLNAETECSESDWETKEGELGNEMELDNRAIGSHGIEIHSGIFYTDFTKIHIDSEETDSIGEEEEEEEVEERQDEDEQKKEEEEEKKEEEKEEEEEVDTDEQSFDMENIDEKTRIVIIGAGIAGIAAAKTLEDAGFTDYIILEAQNDIGGRIRSVSFHDNWIEYGAQYLHGDESELANYCRDKDLLSDTQGSDGEGIYLRYNGSAISMGTSLACDVNDIIYSALILSQSYYHDKTMGKILSRNMSIGVLLNEKFEEYLESCNDPNPIRKMKEEIFEWNTRYLKVDNSCDSLFTLSARLWGKYENAGDNEYMMFKSGYKSLLDSLGESMSKEKIRLSSPVKSISRRNFIGCREDPAIIVKTFEGTRIQASAVIVTCSIGYLKLHYKKMFKPALPKPTRLAIQHIGFGVVNKIFLDYETIWWYPANVKGFQLLPWERHNGKSPFPEWTNDLTGFDVLPNQPNVLVGWVSGRGACIIESLPEETIGLNLTAMLSHYMRRTIPPPRRCIRTTWHNNTYTRGGYSHLTINCDKYDVSTSTLAEPIWTKVSSENNQSVPAVLFAGEGTHDKYYSTVHGAYLTGIQQAKVFLDHHQTTSILVYPLGSVTSEPEILH